MVELAFEVAELAREPESLGPARLRDVTRVAPSVVDALRWPVETASWLTVCPVGPEAVAALAVIDPERVPYPARLDLLVAGQRVQAWLAGLEQRALAACEAAAEAGGPLEASERHFVCQEVAAALRLAPSTAGARLDTAAELGGALAATGAALAAGELSYLHARAVVEETVDLSEQDKRRVEAAVLPAAAASPSVSSAGGCGERSRPWHRKRPSSGSGGSIGSGGSRSARFPTGWPASGRCCPPMRRRRSTPR